MNFHNMCRTCMCEGKVMFPMYSDDRQPHLEEMIMAITSIRIHANDGLPGQVCVKCVNSLDAAVKFKTLVESSDLIFQERITQILSPKEVKLEVISTPDVDVDEDYEDDGPYDIFKSEPEIVLKEENIVVEIEANAPFDLPKPKAFQCNVCGKSYTGQKSLKRHLAVHKGTGYSCNQCQRIFTRKEHLRKHLKSIHAIKDVEGNMSAIGIKAPVKYDCEFCGVDAPNKALMSKHLRACHKDKLPKRKNSSLPLKHDGKSDSSDDEKTDDLETVIDTRRTVGQVSASGGGPVATIKEEESIDGKPCKLVLEVSYHCGQCGADYKNQQSYAAHMTKHSGPAPKGQLEFSCEVCKKVFNKRKNLKQHILVHNSEKANKCTLCPRAFTRPDQLILHMNNHTGKKRHQCTHCDKGFNMLSTLKDHLRTHSGEKPYLCSTCGKGFTQNTNLKQHLMRHSSIKPFPCDKCSAKFVSKGELDAHLRKHTGEHPFVCDLCGTGFTTSSSLVKHKRIHSGERPYICDLCPLRFTALGTLKNHRRTHTGEKPFACTHCTRAFAQKSDLVSHIRTHTGERPYVCTVCKTPFQQSSALKAHVKTHHPNVINKGPLNVIMESQETPTHHIISIHSDDALTVFKKCSDDSPSPKFENSETEQKFELA